jgi:hypothetical protein
VPANAFELVLPPGDAVTDTATPTGFSPGDCTDAGNVEMCKKGGIEPNTPVTGSFDHTGTIGANCGCVQVAFPDDKRRDLVVPDDSDWAAGRLTAAGDSSLADLDLPGHGRKPTDPSQRQAHPARRRSIDRAQADLSGLNAPVSARSLARRPPSSASSVAVNQGANPGHFDGREIQPNVR